MKWNDINKTPLTEPIPEWYRMTHDAQSEGHILLFGFAITNFMPMFAIIRDDELEKCIVKNSGKYCFGDMGITHWMAVGRPHNDNTNV